MADSGSNGQDLVRARFITTLRGMVGQGRPFSAEAVAVGCEIPHSTIKSYLSDGASPGFNLLKLCGFIGPALTNAMLECIGQTGAHRVDGEAAPAPAVLEHMLQDAHALAAALADGRVDHQERAELVKRLPNLIATLARYHADLARAEC